MCIDVFQFHVVTSREVWGMAAMMKAYDLSGAGFGASAVSIITRPIGETMYATPWVGWFPWIVNAACCILGPYLRTRSEPSPIPLRNSDSAIVSLATRLPLPPHVRHSRPDRYSPSSHSSHSISAYSSVQSLGWGTCCITSPGFVRPYGILVWAVYTNRVVAPCQSRPSVFCWLQS